MKTLFVFLVVALLTGACTQKVETEMAMTAVAQDAAKLDSTHYKVEFENDHVRVLRISYGPGEKSVMHEHPNAVAVILSDGRWKMTDSEGKIEEIAAKAGQVLWTPAVKHLPENMGDEPTEVILVEMKVKFATTKKN